jgi:hypothetical protein
VHLYIYYDVRLDAAEAVLGRIRAMQSELRVPSARLMRRPEARAGAQTWMESYDDVDADFEARLSAAVERHGIAALTGPRHIERFEELP